MTLQQLIVDLTQSTVTGDPDVQVTHFSADSREIGPHGLFVATRGFSADGHDFIDRAMQAGAAAVLAETPAPGEFCEATWVQVPDTTWALAVVSAAFYAHPAEALPVLATTGTNGKTTISYLLCDIVSAAGGDPGLLSTVEIRFAGQRRPTIFTTPPAPVFQALLAEMRDAGCSHAVVEASSHGLHQYRMAAFPVAVAGFTNLSRDHLDYHQTMEEYRAAKARLFDTLARRACFNIDDPTGAEFAARFEGPSLTISAEGRADADIRVIAADFDLDGCRATLETPEGSVRLSTRLIGGYNLQNALVALGMARLAGIPLQVALGALAEAPGARGRLERVVALEGTGPQVFVDYAHTPDALDNALEALRPLVKGRLVCVFGAGGDRDRGKRPEMGAAAARLADLSVITSDNPRTEDPQSIVDAILTGLPDDAPRLVVVDRRVAIERAVALAGPDDVVLIAGKGHEDYQIVGSQRLHFDDVEVASQALARRRGGAA